MRAHLMSGDVIANTVEVDSLDVIPGLVDAAIGGAIGDRIVGGVVVPRVVAAVVPKEVTRRQGMAALIKRGQLANVRAALQNPALEPDPIQRELNLSEFDTSQVFERYRPLTITMGAILGIDLDEWFIFAGGL